MLLALSDVTYVLIGWFKFLLLKFLYEYGPYTLLWNHVAQKDHLFLEERTLGGGGQLEISLQKSVENGTKRSNPSVKVRDREVMSSM